MGMSSVRAFYYAHKLASIAIIIVVVAGGYWAYSATHGTSTATSYVLGTVSRGTIIASVSASGQVSASDQIDIHPKASGDITWLGVAAGDKVRAGQALATIDSTDAKQSVLNAEQSLTQAELQFQKDSAQAPIDYQTASDNLTQANTDLKTTYSDTFNTLSDTYLAMPAVMTGLQNTLYGYDLTTAKSQWNIDAMQNALKQTDSNFGEISADAAKSAADYTTALNDYNASLDKYKVLTRYSDNASLESSLADSVTTVTAIAQALQSTLNFMDAIINHSKTLDINVNPAVNTLRANAQGYLSTANSSLSSLLAEQKSLQSAKQSVTNYENTLTLLKVGNPGGDNPISLQSSANSIVTQKQQLQQLKDALADYTIVAPFSGTMASVGTKRYDSVSTGTTFGTLIADQDVATLSLNEVDVAKVKVGDKATMTFDAIDGLTLTGHVATVDSVGTVSQGVVSYKLQIAFDAQDPRVKPGMTVNANIITDIKTDVLMVPSSAVKTTGGQSVVQSFNPPLQSATGTQGVVSATPPRQIPVTIGIADDANVEIVSGLNEGEQIVVRTITGTATASTASTATRGGAGAFGGGGAFRALGGAAGGAVLIGR